MPTLRERFRPERAALKIDSFKAAINRKHGEHFVPDSAVTVIAGLGGRYQAALFAIGREKASSKKSLASEQSLQEAQEQAEGLKFILVALGQQQVAKRAEHVTRRSAKLYRLANIVFSRHEHQKEKDHFRAAVDRKSGKDYVPDAGVREIANLGRRLHHAFAQTPRIAAALRQVGGTGEYPYFVQEKEGLIYILNEIGQQKVLNIATEEFVSANAVRN